MVVNPEIAAPRRSRIGVVALLAVLVCSYVAGYGAVRWRKLLVRTGPYPLMGSDCDITIVPGHDVRTNWIGRVKNQVAPLTATIFAPMIGLEETLWNRSPLIRKYLSYLHADDGDAPLICIDLRAGISIDEFIQNLPDDTNKLCE